LTGVDIIAAFINILSWVLIIAIIVRSLMSWFPNFQGGGLSRVLDDITEPILAPVRRVLPPVGGMDFSPIIAVLVIGVVRYVVLAIL
jgi:YggT family protein